VQADCDAPPVKSRYYWRVQTQGIEVAGTVTVADMVKFCYFSTFRWLWPLMLLGIIVLPLNLALFASGNSSAASNMAPLSFLVLLWAVLPYYSARRQATTRRFLCGPLKYYFDTEGFHVTAASFSGSMSWSTVKRIQETKSAILLYEASYLGRIVPKHFFQTEADLAAFKSFLVTRISPKQIASPGIVGRWC
jgi:hypothetical protein